MVDWAGMTPESRVVTSAWAPAPLLELLPEEEELLELELLPEELLLELEELELLLPELEELLELEELELPLLLELEDEPLLEEEEVVSVVL